MKQATKDRLFDLGLRIPAAVEIRGDTAVDEWAAQAIATAEARGEGAPASDDLGASFAELVGHRGGPVNLLGLLRRINEAAIELAELCVAEGDDAVYARLGELPGWPHFQEWAGEVLGAAPPDRLPEPEPEPEPTAETGPAAEAPPEPGPGPEVQADGDPRGPEEADPEGSEEHTPEPEVDEPEPEGRPRAVEIQELAAKSDPEPDPEPEPEPEPEGRPRAVEIQELATKSDPEPGPAAVADPPSFGMELEAIKERLTYMERLVGDHDEQVSGLNADARALEGRALRLEGFHPAEGNETD